VTELQKITSLPADDSMPGWFHTSPSRTPRPEHVGQKKARWGIVGAGLTGLAAARQLALNFPEDEVVLIEAQEVGYGSAGRNAGFAIDVPHDIGAKDYIGDVTTANLIHRRCHYRESYPATQYAGTGLPAPDCAGE